MSQFQIFKNDGQVKVVDMSKFTSPDDVNELLKNGFESKGFLEAQSDAEAVFLYTDDPLSVSKRLESSDIETTQEIEESLSIGTSKVSVVDISMPFGSMVVFMVKWAIASIPAMFILLVIYMIFTTLLGGVSV